MSDNGSSAPETTVVSASDTTGAAMMDRETRAIVENVTLELQADPPIKCPITFHWAGNEDLANKVTAHLQFHALLLRRRHPWLNFDALDSVIFHYDYTQALRDVSERAGRPCRATSEASGIGLAMVVHLDEKCVAVLDAGLALGVVDTDAAHQNLCLDTVMHELCHVYDYGRKRTLLAHEFLKRKISGLEQHTFTAAEAAWSEYFANRYSNAASSSPDMHPKYLSEVVRDVSVAIRNAIIAYRTSAKLDELLLLCEQKVHFLFQCFGYAAGRLIANGATLEEIAPESSATLKEAGLGSIWNAVICELKRLDEHRDSWTSFDEFKPLMEVVDLTFHRFGLFYSDANGKVRVDIPYSPKTMPAASSALKKAN